MKTSVTKEALSKRKGVVPVISSNDTSVSVSTDLVGGRREGRRGGRKRERGRERERERERE